MTPPVSGATQGSGIGIAKLLEGLSALLAGPIDAEAFEATRSQLAEQVGALQAHLKLSAVPAQKAPYQTSLDPGLPGVQDARATIEMAFQLGNQFYVAPIWVERIQLILMRYGQNVAEQVMQVCSQQVISRMLRTHDQLFYWGGAGLLAVLQRDENLPGTRSELMRVLSTPVNQYFETEHRTIYLPIRMSGELFPLTGSPDSVHEQIQGYFSNRSL